MTDSEKLDLILSEMQDLKQRTATIETNATDIKLTLENEIRVNIQRVAEDQPDSLKQNYIYHTKQGAKFIELSMTLHLVLCGSYIN